MAETKPSGKIPAKPGKDVIYLDPDDEITGIIDKVEASKEKVVALVLPKRSTSLQSIVNMRLLRRSADNAGKNVVLITKEEALLPLAGAAGLHAAETLHSKPEVPPSPRPGAPAPSSKDLPADEEPDVDEDSAKLDYHRSIGVLAAAGLASEADDAEEINLDDEDDDKGSGKDKEEKTPKAAKPSKDSKVKVPNFDRFRLMLLAAAGAGVLLIVFIYLAIFVLPKAKIVIQTTSTPVSANFTVTTSDTAKTLDETKNIIPSVVKTSDFSSTQSVTATGQQNNGTKATGSATLTNCTNSPVSIPAGTGISTNGLTFITQKEVDLDSGNFTSGGVCKTSGNHIGSTSITSQQAGAKYNTTISGAAVSGYSGVTASGSTSGGTDNIVTVVSQSDVDNAQNKVSTTDTDNFQKNFQSQLTGSGLYIVPTTLKAGTPVVTSTPAVGQPASTVSVNIKITYTALTVLHSDLQKIITDNLNKQINQKEQKISSTDVVKDSDISVQSQSSPGVAVLAIDTQTTAVPILNLNAIKVAAAGKKSGVIVTAINSQPGVKGVVVDFSPFWVSKAPKASKITVVQVQVKGGS